jgi:hypothetical protein
VAYAPITWDDVVAVAPELADDAVAVAYQLMALGYVEEVVSFSEFGCVDSYRYKLARAYLAAHIATYFGWEGAEYDVASMSEGGVSVSYMAAGGGADGDLLGATGYGTMFLALVRRSPASAGFVTGVRR